MLQVLLGLLQLVNLLYEVRTAGCVMTKKTQNLIDLLIVVGQMLDHGRSGGVVHYMGIHERILDWNGQRVGTGAIWFAVAIKLVDSVSIRICCRGGLAKTVRNWQQNLTENAKHGAGVPPLFTEFPRNSDQGSISLGDSSRIMRQGSCRLDNSMGPS